MGGAGSKTKEEMKLIVETKIETEIDNMNKTVTELITKQITNTSTSIINTNAVGIDQGTALNINGRISGINMTGHNNKFEIVQQATVESQNKAVVQLLNNNSEMTNLSSQLTADLQSKMKNDSALSEAVTAAAQVNAAKNDENAGGIGGMVDKVMTMIDNMGPGKEITKETETTIKNSLKMTLKNVNIDEKKIDNTIEKNITSAMKSINENSCKANTSANLNLIIEDIKINGEGLQFIYKQSGTVKAFNECITGSSNINEITRQLEDSNVVTVANDQGNKNSIDRKADATASVDVSTSKYVGAALEDMISKIATGPGCVIFAIIYAVMCALICGIGILMKLSGSSQPS